MMKTTKLNDIGGAQRIAHVMWIANFVAGVIAIFPTLYALVCPPVLIIPVIGYVLLVGYWRRAGHLAEPVRWLWIATIFFNLPPVVGVAVFWGEIEQPAMTGLLIAWNLLMIYGAVRALRLDWAEIRDGRRELVIELNY